MSTFLEICQDTAREVGIPGDGPVTTVGQTGQLRDIVRWVKQGYVAIQNRNGGHWRWLRRRFTLTTSAADDKYAPTDAIDIDSAVNISRFSQWRVSDRDLPPTIFLVSAGSGTQTWLVYAEWEPWQQIYRISNQIDSYPAHITVDPQNNLLFGPQPNDIYTITGEYWKSAQILTADADVPELPSQYHDLLIYYAIEKYGYLEAAPEVLARANTEKRAFMRQLERNQLDRFTVARPLA